MTDFDDLDDDREDDRMMWEEYADSAVERLIEGATFDEITGTVRLPARDSHPHGWGAEVSSLEELEDYLREIYNEEWYAYVPFDGGEAVFEDDAWGVVENLLSRERRFADFFDRYAAPENSDEIVTAGDLILDHSASLQIRVTLEEINDELVAYLATHPELMRDMQPRKFEELVAAMFKNQGYDVTLTPRSADGGIDVIAVQKSGIGTAMIIVECKRYSAANKVGVEIVRGLYGVVEQKRATQGLIATTSFFTRGAKDFCSQIPYRMGLADFDSLSLELNKWKQRIELERRSKR